MASTWHHSVQGGVVGSTFTDFECGALGHFERGEDAALAAPVMPWALIGIFLEQVDYLLAEKALEYSLFVVRELYIVSLEYHLREFRRNILQAVEAILVLNHLLIPISFLFSFIKLYL